MKLLIIEKDVLVLPDIVWSSYITLFGLTPTMLLLVVFNKVFVVDKIFFLLSTGSYVDLYNNNSL